MATFQQVNPNGTVKKNLKWVKWVVAGAAALVIAFSSFTIVPAGSTGVVMTLGKVSETSLQEGLNFKIPFIQSVEVMSNKIQVYETDFFCRIKGFADGQQQNCRKLPCKHRFKSKALQKRGN